MNRKEFKRLVKECLIEILSEGISNGVQEQVFAQPKRQTESVQHTRPALNNISYGQKPQQSQPNKQVVKQLTKDPIMESIFADTMQTTLASQDAVETPGRVHPVVGGDMATRVVSQFDPTELFADSAAKWEELAFAKPRQQNIFPEISDPSKRMG